MSQPGNSSFSVEDSNAFAFTWAVDGLDQLFIQQFFYRVSPGGGEQSFNTLTLSGTSQPTDYLLNLQYTGNGFTVDFRYLLTGGTPGSGVSDLAQNVNITNTSGSDLEFHFFQYNDFDLFRPPNFFADQLVEQLNANTVRQTAGCTVLTEQVGTPAPDWFQVDHFATIADSLGDQFPTTLNGNATFLGDAAWAWQWDFNIAAGDTVQISKDMRIDVAPIPVPAAVWLFGSGLIGLVGIARRKTRF